MCAREARIQSVIKTWLSVCGDGQWRRKSEALREGAAAGYEGPAFGFCFLFLIPSIL